MLIEIRSRIERPKRQLENAQDAELMRHTRGLLEGLQNEMLWFQTWTKWSWRTWNSLAMTAMTGIKGILFSLASSIYTGPVDATTHTQTNRTILIPALGALAAGLLETLKMRRK
jgi:hypothetical protein